MGMLGYSFIDLTKEQAHARRLLLDRYGLIAQLSLFFVLVTIQIYHFLAWLTRRCGEVDIERTPSSPYLKAGIENDKLSWKTKAKRCSAKIRWWMDDEVASEWGKKGEWIGGALWMSWLLTLCFRETGEDYMHLTKRFGIVAASQLPLHYLLAMKSSYSPLQMLTRLSHENLISVHQVLGKIIQCLFTLHAAFYLNFFVQVNVLAKRSKDRDVILGMACIAIITITSTAALRVIKTWNYRLFYMIHVASATLFLPLAYFHVNHIRPYILESACIYALHLILSLLYRQKQNGSIGLVPGTDLVEIKIPLKGGTSHFRPGQHVYFSLPQGYPGSSIPNLFLKNPFTIANLPQKDGHLLLVARALRGNTKKLAKLAHKSNFQVPSVHGTLPLRIEGPYGASSYLPEFASFDRILLVAGGVGATYVIPLWRTILRLKRHQNQHLDADIKMVWAVRRLSETTWALPLPEAEAAETKSDSKMEVEVYVTGATADSLVSGASDSMELADTATLVNHGSEELITRQGIAVKYSRPNLHDIVEDTFSGHVGQVAVLTCGPAGMLKQLRREVRKQVWRGKYVFWHAEEFSL
ncbi:uncharacterized protein PV09_07377 [Verruconis gallopava]|uniref:ferric-chelate reductase (NADPH) n=1 Tax=Verruconis gallopava TaxID=253628 RepID=A0A0D2A3S8_9PEZI|nr:uncharacterized protein PV09_07377 [Verruconis gallopava]KIW01090.1 hypothetical protein PV09_07377 [Verruconis gallopava]